jgi:RTX calcium-binding nonapeptide repeat (4 copies)
MRRSVLAMTVAALALQCAPALAASVRIDKRKSVVVYRAAPNERNQLVISPSEGVWIDDEVPIHAGPGCESADRSFVRCELVKRVVIRLGDRSDLAFVLKDPEGSSSFNSVLLDGGRGDDRLNGGPERDTLIGGNGTDVLQGGRGVDQLMADWPGMDDVTADRLRGGPGSDSVLGSAGPNLIDPGAGVDQVRAGGGRDIVLTRDGTIEQIHCGAGLDSAVTDGFDFPLACERHEPYSAASPVPLEFRAAAGEPRASFLLGCRESHPAQCVGTAQLELGDRALSDERPFTYANRHRLVIVLDTLEPMPADWATSPDLAIRIRARDAGGAPTNDRYPVQAMLVGNPFLN